MARVPARRQSARVPEWLAQEAVVAVAGLSRTVVRSRYGLGATGCCSTGLTGRAAGCAGVAIGAAAGAVSAGCELVGRCGPVTARTGVGAGRVLPRWHRRRTASLRRRRVRYGRCSWPATAPRSVASQTVSRTTALAAASSADRRRTPARHALSDRVDVQLLDLGLGVLLGELLSVALRALQIALVRALFDAPADTLPVRDVRRVFPCTSDWNRKRAAVFRNWIRRRAWKRRSTSLRWTSGSMRSIPNVKYCSYGERRRSSLDSSSTWKISILSVTATARAPVSRTGRDHEIVEAEPTCQLLNAKYS